jgi:putative hydrolase of the HAD superfamily
VIQIEAVVFDFDGVVRHWYEEDTASVERAHGLAPGSIMGVAFGPDLGELVVTGGITHLEWFAAVGERLGSPEAVAEWSSHRGEVDPEAVALIDELRAAGITVGLLSNATTRLEEDLDVLGLASRLDHIFNTARLGVCKPNPAVYHQVVARLGLVGAQIAFTDDHPGWAAAAGTADINGLPFVGIERLRTDLRFLGVPVDA